MVEHDKEEMLTLLVRMDRNVRTLGYIDVAIILLMALIAARLLGMIR